MTGTELRRALKVIARVLDEGERSHSPGAPNYWNRLRVRDHVARALVHGEKSLLRIESGEDDLAHACVRLVLALELRERRRDKGLTNLLVDSE